MEIHFQLNTFPSLKGYIHAKYNTTNLSYFLKQKSKTPEIFPDKSKGISKIRKLI